MKIILDPASINLTDSVKIRPDRLYFCQTCNRSCTRKNVRKDANGIYHCQICDHQVRDITDSNDGQHLAGILGL